MITKKEWRINMNKKKEQLFIDILLKLVNLNKKVILLDPRLAKKIASYLTLLYDLVKEE